MMSTYSTSSNPNMSTVSVSNASMTDASSDVSTKKKKIKNPFKKLLKGFRNRRRNRDDGDESSINSRIRTIDDGTLDGVPSTTKGLAVIREQALFTEKGQENDPPTSSIATKYGDASIHDSKQQLEIATVLSDDETVVVNHSSTRIINPVAAVVGKKKSQRQPSSWVYILAAFVCLLIVLAAAALYGRKGIPTSASMNRLETMVDHEDVGAVTMMDAAMKNETLAALSEKVQEPVVVLDQDEKATDEDSVGDDVNGTDSSDLRSVGYTPEQVEQEIDVEPNIRDIEVERKGELEEAPEIILEKAQGGAIENVEQDIDLDGSMEEDVEKEDHQDSPTAEEETTFTEKITKHAQLLADKSAQFLAKHGGVYYQDAQRFAVEIKQEYLPEQGLDGIYKNAQVLAEQGMNGFTKNTQVLADKTAQFLAEQGVNDMYKHAKVFAEHGMDGFTKNAQVMANKTAQFLSERGVNDIYKNAQDLADRSAQFVSEQGVTGIYKNAQLLVDKSTQFVSEQSMNGIYQDAQVLVDKSAQFLSEQDEQSVRYGSYGLACICLLLVLRMMTTASGKAKLDRKAITSTDELSGLHPRDTTKLDKPGLEHKERRNTKKHNRRRNNKRSSTNDEE